MNPTSLLLLCLNYVLIMSLPFVFFEKRDRRRSPMWWVTATPFIVLPFAIGAEIAAIVPPLLPRPGAAATAIGMLAVVPSALSIALVAASLGVHRQPLPQWHQEQDCPPTLVMKGPYACVRHPFYVAYLLMFVAAVALVPGIATLGSLLYAFAALDHTAAREEKRLSKSAFGVEYRAYLARTGRFLPLLHGGKT